MTSMGRPARYAAARWIISTAPQLLLSLLVALTVAEANSQELGIDDVAAQRDRAVELGRAGRYDEALDSLQKLRSIEPDNQRLLYDHVAILGWANRDQDVLDNGLSIAADIAPDFVQLAIAKSARNLRQYSLAAEWYEQAVQSDPSDIEARLGLAMTYADQGDPTAAKETIAAIEQADAKLDTVRLAQSYVLARADNLIQALALYDAILADSPDNRDAWRGKALVLRSLLLPRQALELAVNHPGILSEQEMARLRVDNIAIQVRLASKTPYPPGRREYRLSNTLAALDEFNATARNDATKEVLAYDRIVVLADDNQSEAAAIAFESLTVDIELLPAYVLAAAGRAYLHNHQPRKALRVLQRAVEVNPNELDLKFSLIYAYLDLDRYADAYALTDALTAELPLTNTETGSSVIKGNQDRLNAELIAGIAEAYGDQLAQAQHRFEQLLADAPNNRDLRHELANVYRWRGWLDRSLFEYRQVLAVAEDMLNAQVGYAHAQLDTSQFRAVEMAVDDLNLNFRNEPSVERLSEQWRLHNKRELALTGSFGDSSGTTFGSDQYRIDTTYYTQPKAYQFRGLLTLHDSLAEFPEGDSNRRRLGVGTEYRAERWTAVGKLSANRSGGGDLGISGSVDWRISDRWALAGLLDRDSNDLPLRGHRVGVSNDLLGATAHFAPHEATAVDFGWRYFDYSDGNEGTSLFTNGRHRLINRPRWKFDFTGELFVSSNDLQNASYFSPSHDVGLLAGATHEWRLLRRYERNLVQVAELQLGRYDQAGFSAGRLWRFNYELRLQLNNALHLSLGAERSRMFYDGSPEYNTFFVTTVQARF